MTYMNNIFLSFSFFLYGKVVYPNFGRLTSAFS